MSWFASRPTNALRGVQVVVDFGAGAATDLQALAVAREGLGSVITSLASASLETAVLWLGWALSLEKRWLWGGDGQPNQRCKDHGETHCRLYCKKIWRETSKWIRGSRKFFQTKCKPCDDGGITIYLKTYKRQVVGLIASIGAEIRLYRCFSHLLLLNWINKTRM